MKRFITYPQNNGWLRKDHFDVYRSEGRYAINIGCALSEMGYEVDLISTNFDNKLFSPTLYDGNKSRYPFYDLCYLSAYYHIFRDVNFKQGIAGVYAFHEIEEVLKLESHIRDRVIITCHYNTPVLNQLRNKFPELNIKYLPPVYPITSLSKTFLPFKDLSDRKELNIVVIFSPHFSTKEKLLTALNEKLSIILSFIKSSYSIKKLTIFERNDSYKETFGVDNTQFFRVPISYKDLLDLLLNTDLVIFYTTEIGAGACQYDIVSLGIPFIPLTGRSNLNPPVWVSPLFTEKDLFLTIDSSKQEVLSYCEKFFNNPKLIFDRFRQHFTDCEFENWKKIFEGLFV